jgi:hypothetical protein
MRARTLIPAAALATLAASAPASAHTINVAGGKVGGHVSSIGDFRPSSDPTIAAAARVFGRPSSRTRTSDLSCDVRWRRLRLRITFTNFGGVPPGQTICGNRASKAQTFRVRGRRFPTWKGLRVDDAESRVQELHPKARFRGGRWWIQTTRSLVGDPSSRFPVVEAFVNDAGRIRAIRGWIGAAGD